MKQHFGKSVALSALFATGFLAIALPAAAQMGPGMMGAGNSMRGSYAGQMSELQRDMAGEMATMSGVMSKGSMSPALQKQMGERMHTMADMMKSTSNMMGQGKMMNPDNQKRMDQMRTQMDALMHGGQQVNK